MTPCEGERLRKRRTGKGKGSVGQEARRQEKKGGGHSARPDRPPDAGKIENQRSRGQDAPKRKKWGKSLLNMLPHAQKQKERDSRGLNRKGDTSPPQLHGLDNRLQAVVFQVYGHGKFAADYTGRDETRQKNSRGREPGGGGDAKRESPTETQLPIHLGRMTGEEGGILSKKGKRYCRRPQLTTSTIQKSKRDRKEKKTSGKGF